MFTNTRKQTTTAYIACFCNCLLCRKILEKTIKTYYLGRPPDGYKNNWLLTVNKKYHIQWGRLSVISQSSVVSDQSLLETTRKGNRHDGRVACEERDAIFTRLSWGLLELLVKPAVNELEHIEMLNHYVEVLHNQTFLLLVQIGMDELRFRRLLPKS